MRWIHVLSFALPFVFWGARALGASVVAEVKVYPAPGQSMMTNVEIGNPAAKLLFESLPSSGEILADGAFKFTQKTSDFLTCTQRTIDGGQHSYLCVMNMDPKGVLLPGVSAEFGEEGGEAPRARGVGEVRVEVGLRQVKISISTQAAKALFSNMSVEAKSEQGGAVIKAAANLNCVHRLSGHGEDSLRDYSCQAILSKRQRGLALSESERSRR